MSTDPTTVRRQIVVNAPIAEAFEVFTNGVDGDRGWPLYLERYAALFDAASPAMLR